MTSRKLARGVGAWMFGFATTIFLLSMWGRAVVVDVGALEEAAAPLAESSAVANLFTDWLDQEMADSGVAPATAQIVVDDVMTRSTVVGAMGRFAGELVTAAAAPGPEPARVDMSGLLQPAIPEIEAALSAAGVTITEERVAEVVAQLDPLVVRRADTEPFIGAESPTAARLGTAAILSLLVMGATGWATVVTSEDRAAEARSLLSRVALGALSFSILLKFGSWVLDPSGGRAPIAESLGRVAGAKWLHPMAIGLAAGLAAAVTWWRRRRLRPEAVSLSADVPPTSTPERPLSRSGSR